MSEFCEASIDAQAGYRHCWHATGAVKPMIPPLNVEVCCWCGESRDVPDPHWREGRHGPHLPPYTTDTPPREL